MRFTLSLSAIRVRHFPFYNPFLVGGWTALAVVASCVHCSGLSRHWLGLQNGGTFPLEILWKLPSVRLLRFVWSQKRSVSPICTCLRSVHECQNPAGSIVAIFQSVDAACSSLAVTQLCTHYCHTLDICSFELLCASSSPTALATHGRSSTYGEPGATVNTQHTRLGCRSGPCRSQCADASRVRFVNTVCFAIHSSATGHMNASSMRLVGWQDYIGEHGNCG